MKVLKTKIPDVKLFEPKIFGDSRGYFFESFNAKELVDLIPSVEFVQDNESLSEFGVIRGLHVQRPPFAQAKLIRVIKGRVFDVAVDLREDSPTRGQHVDVILDDQKKQQLYIPKGFAHGFLVLSETAIFSYKVDQYYNLDAELTLKWDDPTLDIGWPLRKDKYQFSDKDEKGLTWKDFPKYSSREWQL
ncbi:dTDP-4-dehydrorhamnose 3,5-epimerase [bacterium]|nr:dTDP-4-dehydrorhamnose 3,5-epimerase [bacterium]